MAKLTKKQAQLHRQACEPVALDRGLDEDEKELVLQHWQECSTAANALEGAFSPLWSWPGTWPSKSSVTG